MTPDYLNPDFDVHDRYRFAKDRITALEQELERMKQPKIAPVQGYSAGIPWSMHLRAYDVYCKRYGSQQALIDLEGRNCRGGFSASELDEFIPGWRVELDELAQAKAEIERLKVDLKIAQVRDVDHVASAVLSLQDQLRSTKKERDTLRSILIEIGRDAGCVLADNVSTEFLANLPNELRLQRERMGRPVTEGFWAIVSFYTQDIIGVCANQADVLAEEPKATFIPISEADYESFDEWDRAKKDAILAARARK